MNKTYTISAELRLEVDIEINAESLEHAIELSKDLKVSDFVTMGSNNFIDGEMVIKGVWRPNQNFTKR